MNLDFRHQYHRTVVATCLVYAAIAVFASIDSQTCIAAPCNPLLLPAKVELVAPENNSIDYSATRDLLQWNASALSAKYELEVRTDSMQSDSVIMNDSLELYADWICGACTIYQLHPLANKKTYYWRVRGVNSCGPGEWSDIRTFRSGLAGEQGISIQFIDLPDDVRFVALNTKQAWTNNFLGANYKEINGNKVEFSEEDFPYLPQQDFSVQRIEFLSDDARTLRGHINISYIFTQRYPRPAKMDIIVQFHKDIPTNRSKFSGWRYFLDQREHHVSAVIAPRGELRHINPNNVPIVLVHGIGASAWEYSDNRIDSSFIDAWEYRYAADAEVDSSAKILSRMTTLISQRFYNNAKVGIAAHGSGGLVARSLGVTYNHNQTVAKILLLGTPNFGSFLARRVLETKDFTGSQHPIFQSMDINSPILSQVAVGSDFLYRLNAQGVSTLQTGIPIANSYLCIAGKQPNVFGTPHDELPNQHDGFTGIATAGLLQHNIPLGIVFAAHVQNSASNEQGLMERSAPILNGFFSRTYSPGEPAEQLLNRTTGFFSNRIEILKPDNPVLSKPHQAIFWNIPFASSQTLSVATIGNEILLEETSTFSTKQALTLQKSKGTQNYISRTNSTPQHIGTLFSPNIYPINFSVPILFSANRFSSTPSGFPVSIPVAAKPDANFGRCETSFATLSIPDNILERWYTAKYKRQQEIISKKDLGGASPTGLDTVYFSIDSYMDTTLVIAAVQNGISPASISSAALSLLAPNGAVISASGLSSGSFQPYNASGFAIFPKLGVAYFSMAEPLQGRWGVVFDASKVQVRLALSYLSDVYISVSVPDSIFTPGSTVQASVFIPDVFFAQPEFSVSVRNPQGMFVEKIIMKPTAQKGIYTGTFVPKENGVYSVDAELFADMSVGRVRRSSSAAVEVYSSLPSKVQLLAPTHLSVNVPRVARLRWEKEKNSTAYQLQLSENEGFDLLLTTYSNILDTILQPPVLLPTKRYFWRVRGLNARGFGPWSTVYIFTTASEILAAPRLLSPINDLKTMRLDTTLTWAPVSDATQYRLQIAVDSAFSSSASEKENVANDVTYRFAMTPLKKYYWRVRAENNAGISAWSEVRTFTRLLEPTELLSPRNQQLQLPVAVQLKWKSVLPQLKHQLQLSRQQDFSTLLINEVGISDSLYSAIMPSNGVLYYWRVRWTIGKDTGDWSPTWSFATILGNPTLDSPSDGVSGVNISPTLTWRFVQHSAQYHLQMAKTPDMTELVFDDSTLNVVSKPMKKLQETTQYFWRVRAKNSYGSSGWSPIWKFTTGLDPNTSVADAYDMGFAIAPNPSSSQAIVSIPSTFYAQQICLYSSLGQALFCKNLENPHITSIMLDLTDYSRGYYVVRIFDGTRYATATLIKE